MFLVAARLILAVVFSVAGLAKLADRVSARRAVIGMGIPARLAAVVAVLLPVAELALAGALVSGATTRWAAGAAVVLLGAFSGLIARNLARDGEQEDCGCFGSLGIASTGWFALGRNAVLLVLAGAVLIASPDEPPSAFGWLDTGRASWVLVGALVTLVALVALEGLVMVYMVRRHGRLLHRLDALESAAQQHARSVGDAPPVNFRAERRSGDGPSPRAVPDRTVGHLAPPVTLRDLSGAAVDLSACVTTDAVILFWNPDCGFCSRMLPALQAWEDEAAAESLRLIVVSSAGVTDGRAMGLRSTVLLDPGMTAMEAFGVQGTPVAVLVDGEGRIRSAPAIGAAEIFVLLGAQLMTTAG